MVLLRSLLFNLLFFGWTVVLLLVSLPLLLAPPAATVALARLWARGVMRLLAVVGLRFEVRGRQHLGAGPAIIAAKHQSAWDTMIFLLLLDDPAYVLKKELLNIPIYGQFVRKARMVAVDRAGGAKALKGMVSAAKAALATGRSLVIFPEGTRVAPGRERPYHPGAAALYLRLGLPVVPVALNSGLFWGRRSFVKRPGVITLEFLPPIPPGLNRSAFTDTLRRCIEAGSRRLEREAADRYGFAETAPA